MCDLDDIKRQLREITACPIDWARNPVCASLHDALIDHWAAFVETRQVDLEAGFVDEVFMDIFDDEEFLVPGLKNWQQWSPGAKADFLRLTAHLFETKMATRANYPKHYARYGSTKSEIRAATERSNSLLYDEMTPENQLLILQEVMAAYFDDFLDTRHRIISVRTPSIVGASRGRDTSLINFDVHFSSRLAHCYPVVAEEIDRDDPIYDFWPPGETA